MAETDRQLFPFVRKLHPMHFLRQTVAQEPNKQPQYPQHKQVLKING